MNRLWLGIGILILLFAFGLWITAAVGSTHADISALLSEAGQASAAGDWENAKLRFQDAKQLWQRSRSHTAAITDHAPMEEIDRFFSQTEVYLQMGYLADFCAGCQALAVLTQAVGEAQEVTWWSLL